MSAAHKLPASLHFLFLNLWIHEEILMLQICTWRRPHTHTHTPHSPTLVSFSVSFLSNLSIPPISFWASPTTPEPPHPAAEVCLATRHFHTGQWVSKYNSNATKWKPDLNNDHEQVCVRSFCFPYEELPLTKLGPWSSQGMCNCC